MQGLLRSEDEVALELARCRWTTCDSRFCTGVINAGGWAEERRREGGRSPAAGSSWTSRRHSTSASTASSSSVSTSASGSTASVFAGRGSETLAFVRPLLLRQVKPVLTLHVHHGLVPE